MARHGECVSEYDERSFDRPSRSNSRRRSKDRPDYSSAIVGRVTGIDRGRITCAVPDEVSHDLQTTVIAVKARDIGRKGLVVGDRVRLVGDLSGKVDTLARIVEIVERTNVLTRTADDSDPVERTIVANATQLAIVVAVANPEPRTGLIDRALVAAYDADLQPLLILTKIDLANPDNLLSHYAHMDLDCLIVNQHTGEGLDAVRQHLSGEVTVLLGHSGVGKSTLVNALCPDADRLTGDVNDVTGRGRHTSTSARAIPLPHDSGWVIDTPGVRSFGLAHVNPDHIIGAFPELDEGSSECPRACTHVNSVGEAPPDCALDEWVRGGHAGESGASRLASLRRLLITLQTASS